MHETMTASSNEAETFYGLDPLQREAYEWISRFMARGLNADEVAAMRAWFAQSHAHAAAYAKARGVWNALGPVASARMREPGASEQIGAGASLHARPAHIGRRSLIGGALAASAAYAAAKPPLDLWPSYSELLADYRTGTGEMRQVRLADAVSLDLNTRTSIAIQSRATEATRIELIAGEVVISASAAPAELTVVARSGRIVATHSDFNLRCDGSEVSITCLNGALRVHRDGMITPLGAQQQVSYSDRSISSVIAVDLDNVTAWRRGRLIFESTPVAQVVAEINRYRRGRIVLMNDEIGQRLLTARLRTTETDRIILQIVEIFGAKARTLPGGIVILT